MRAKRIPHHSQGSFLHPDLIDQLDPKDALLLLGNAIQWEQFENEFAPLYADCGRPAKPIRLMVGLLMLKQLENLSHKRVVAEGRRHPYFQVFCGMKNFQRDFPCGPSYFCHFTQAHWHFGHRKDLPRFGCHSRQAGFGMRDIGGYYCAGKEYHLPD